MRRRWLVLIPGALLLAFLPTPAQAVGDCEGYPEPRVFQEAQGWWQPPGTENFGHVHIGACFPRTHLPDGTPNKVSGRITLDTVVKLHDNPGRLDFVRVHLNDGAGGNRQVARVDIDQSCAVSDCTFNVPITFDTNASPVDGFQNIRLAAIVQHRDGTKQFGGTAWQMYIANGKTVDHQAGGTGAPLPRQVTHGWYTGALYGNAELRSWLPYTVSGVWSPQVRLDKGSGGKDVARSFASIDPNMHAGILGTVILDRPGPYTGPLTIDTRTLTNGPHKLFLRSEAPCDGTVGNDCGRKASGASNNVASNSGVQVVTFVVAN